MMERMTQFTVTVTVCGDSPKDALRNLQDLLDHDARVASYTTETFVDGDGERDTAELM